MPPQTHVRRMTSKWTAERLARVRKLFVEDGLPASQVVEMLRPDVITTRNAIIGLASRHRWLVGLARRERATPRRRRYTPRLKGPPMFIEQPAPVVPIDIPFQPNPCRIMELTADRCRWIEGESDAPGGAVYCGAFTGGLSWCEHHGARVFNPKYLQQSDKKTV